MHPTPSNRGASGAATEPLLSGILSLLPWPVLPRWLAPIATRAGAAFGQTLLAYLASGSERCRRLRINEMRDGLFPRRVLTGCLIVKAPSSELAVRVRVDGGVAEWNGREGTVKVQLLGCDEATSRIHVEVRDGDRVVGAGWIALGALRLREVEEALGSTTLLEDGPQPLSVRVFFQPAHGDSTGLTYEPSFPVLSERVRPYPRIVEPLPSHLEMTRVEISAMAALGSAMLLAGGEAAQMGLPEVRHRKLVADTGAEFWAFRRMNGFNPGHLRRVQGRSWQYETRLDCGYERLAPYKLPVRATARFTLSRRVLRAHSIRLVYDDGRVVQAPYAESAAWHRARAIYELVEANYHSNAMHVAIHFDVEQYAIAAYRNLFRNPVLTLLEPHLADTSYTSREVVWPRDTGVVTLAYQLTAEGQARQIRDRLAELNFRWTPKPLPDRIRNNHFEAAEQAMWELLGIYVQRFFDRHEASIQRHWGEVTRMSRDLVEHSLCRTGMKIESLDDLKALCRYVILRATLHHSWFHFKDREDAQTFEGVEFEPGVPEGQRRARLEIARAVQFTTHYISYFKSQFPIVDEAAGLPDLASLLREFAPRIDPGFDHRRIVSTPNS